MKLTTLFIAGVAALALDRRQSETSLVQSDITSISEALQALTSSIIRYQGPANIPGVQRILSNLDAVNDALRTATNDANSLFDLSASDSEAVAAGADKLTPLATQAVDALIRRREDFTGSGPFEAVFGPPVVRTNLRYLQRSASDLGRALEGAVTPDAETDIENDFETVDEDITRALRAFSA